MYEPRLLWNLAWVALLLLPALVSAALDLTHAQKQLLLDAHNFYRRKEVKEKGAIGMRLVEWDSRLEEHAVKYLKECKYDHSDDDERAKYGKKGEQVGENIWRTAEPTLTNVTGVVGLWYDEIKFFTYDPVGKGQCVGVCGHYTQVVWSATYRVGCGAARCMDAKRNKLQTLVNCAYAPMGNYASPPYTIGSPPCGSSCPRRLTGCVNDLCAEAGAKEPKVPSPGGDTPKTKGEAGTLATISLTACLMAAYLSWAAVCLAAGTSHGPL